MKTIDVLWSEAKALKDSELTRPKANLSFPVKATTLESLKKLQNHGLNLEYTYTIEVAGKTYTRIVASDSKSKNPKNDVFCGWMEDSVFPSKKGSNKLYIIRWVPNKQKIKRLQNFTENCNDPIRQTCYATNSIPLNATPVTLINDTMYYAGFWPVIEHPQVELYKKQVEHQIRDHINDVQRDYDYYAMDHYLDVVRVCNYYKFGETYNNMGPGLQKIYRCLYENHMSEYYKDLVSLYIFQGDRFISEVERVLGEKVNYDVLNELAASHRPSEVEDKQENQVVSKIKRFFLNHQNNHYYQGAHCKKNANY